SRIVQGIPRAGRWSISSLRKSARVNAEVVSALTSPSLSLSVCGMPARPYILHCASLVVGTLSGDFPGDLFDGQVGVLRNPGQQFPPRLGRGSPPPERPSSARPGGATRHSATAPPARVKRIGRSGIPRRRNRLIPRKTRSEPARQPPAAPAGRASDNPAGRSRGG